MTPTDVHMWAVLVGTIIISGALMLLVSYAVAVIKRRRGE